MANKGEVLDLPKYNVNKLEPSGVWNYNHMIFYKII